MKHQWVVNDPATDKVFWNVKKLLTLGSKETEVPPKVRSSPELAVAATPPDWKMPEPMMVELAPAAPIVRTTQLERKYHGPESDETGVVWTIEVPKVVPGEVVPRPGVIVSAPLAPVVIRPPASMM